MSEKIIHHIEIFVSDLARTNEFWGWLLEELGYERWQNWDRGMSWKKDDAAIIFSQVVPTYQDTRFTRPDVRINHLTFSVPSRDVLDRIMRRLALRNVPLLYADNAMPVKKGEKETVYFEDPDRIKVELVCDEATQ